MTVNDDGIVIPVYKPKGMTSFEVVRTVRRELSVRKVGHAGTLDPLAEGLLIVLTGTKTKLMSEFLKLEKEYVADLKLGVVSKSWDLETELTERSAAITFKPEMIYNCLDKFKGRIDQLPPEYSATWVNGKRAYNLARRGVDFDLKPKSVTISEIELLKFDPPLLSIRVVCSSGTYIRSLARDIGEELGCGAVLAGLVRTRIGTFTSLEAVKLEDLAVRHAA